AALAGGVRADRHSPGVASRDRGGLQVLSARGVLERIFSLRHRVHLRRDGQHAARSRWQPHRRPGDGSDADAASGDRSPLRGIRVQGVRRAVPHVDARRIRGAPPAVTGFMSTGVKAAAFAAFVRVFLAAFEPLRSDWWAIAWSVASATMIVGTVVGVAQTNVKRMLAYSSIAHGGCVFVAGRAVVV